MKVQAHQKPVNGHTRFVCAATSNEPVKGSTNWCLLIVGSCLSVVSEGAETKERRSQTADAQNRGQFQITMLREREKKNRPKEMV